MGSGIISFKKFNGYVDQATKNHEYVHFRCDLSHFKDSLKKIGKVIIFNHVYLNKN